MASGGVVLSPESTLVGDGDDDLAVVVLALRGAAGVGVARDDAVDGRVRLVACAQLFA